MLTTLTVLAQAPAEDRMTPRRARHGLTVALTTLALASTACGDGQKGPTAPQAEQKLTEHISLAVTRLKRGGAQDVKITAEKGTDSHCSAEGKEQRGIVVTGRIADPQVQEPSDISALLLGALDGEGYKVTYIKPRDPTVRLRNATSRTSLVITAPAKGRMLMNGMTDCLRAK
jgi:hypothetical protein